VSTTRALIRQARLEQLAFWRNPESAFFTIALPIGLLVIFGATSGSESVPGRGGVPAVTFLVPRMLAFGIILAAYATPAATVAILRSDGVLKRMRATPLSETTYVAGHLVSLLITCLLITLATIGLGGLAFGTLPASVGRLAALAATLGVGITCFAALGLAVSSFIPNGAAAGAITNGTYIPLALLSGTFDANLQLPAWLDAVVSALPIKALTDGLRAAYDPAAARWPAHELAVLLVWAVIGSALAIRCFRWEPR
jgi:ABC-2 type transport system permease protein